MTNAEQLADDYWDYRKQRDIFVALNRGDISHLANWPDVSPAGALEAVATYERFAAEARVLITQSLRDEVLAATVAAAATDDALREGTGIDLRLPNLQTGIISWLLPAIAMQPLVTAAHGEDFLTKIRTFPAFVNQVVARLRSAAEEGRVPLRSHALASSVKLEALARSDAQPFGQQSPPLELDPAAQVTWSSDLEKAMREQFVPALLVLAETLRTVTAPAGRPDDEPGLLVLDGGIDVYRRLVKAHTTLDVSADEVHNVGLAQVARLEEEYVAMAGPLLGTTDVSEIYERLRSDPTLHHDDADEIVADALRSFEKAKVAMGDWFGRTPEADCVASATDVGPLAYYKQPSEDGSRPGQFFFNISDPTMWAKCQVAAIAYHEGIPGHHLQLALGIENDEVHDLHRLLYLAGFGEGWGLYTERLADEMGLYEDEWERVGMLYADSLRACRLVVDTGMHAMGWSRQAAIDYMTAHSPMAIYEIEQEIDRYIGMAGQATSYMMGRLEIEAIRARTEERLGDRFDVKDFHDALLSNGTVPLTVLPRIVEARLP